MSDNTLLLPSQTYNPAHERLRNRRIEEVMRRNEIGVGDMIRSIITPTCNVSQLPTSVVAGVRGFVLDSSVNTFNTAVAGGGSFKVPCFFDGTVWRVG